MKKSERTKLRILESARELFALQGYSGVTMKDICERAGLSRGGLYRYYSSTEDVFIHIIELDRKKSFDMLKIEVKFGAPAPKQAAAHSPYCRLQQKAQSAQAPRHCI